jgi:hypothetical protein
MSNNSTLKEKKSTHVQQQYTEREESTHVQQQYTERQKKHSCPTLDKGNTNFNYILMTEMHPSYFTTSFMVAQ